MGIHADGIPLSPPPIGQVTGLRLLGNPSVNAPTKVTPRLALDSGGICCLLEFSKSFALVTVRLALGASVLVIPGSVPLSHEFIHLLAISGEVTGAGPISDLDNSGGNIAPAV